MRVHCAVIATTLCWSLPALAQVNVTTHHYDNLRTGANLNETILTPANVNATQFGKLYNVPLDGQVYTQPLVVSNLQIPGKGAHNVAFVATMNNSVYALDIDNNGQQIWKANFGTPVVPCDVEWHENITQGSHVGILGTPVIDTTTNTIYFVSRNESNNTPGKCFYQPGGGGAQTGDNTAAVFTQFLNALDITTGAPKSGSPVKIAATYTSAEGTLTFNPQIQNQRPALALANSDVYIAFSSHDDQGPYHGWIISYHADTLSQDQVYVDTPQNGNGHLGGIWQAGSAATVDANGNIYLSSGNGDFDTSPNGVPQTGNSFIKLSPKLQLLDYFTPDNSTTLNEGDQDLGSSGLLAIPGTSLVFGGGKQGRAYLVDTNSMGHFHSSNDAVKQEFQAVLGQGTQHIHGTPIYFNSATAGPRIILWGENDFCREFAFDSSTEMVNATPVAMSTMTAPATNANGAMPGGMIEISANGGSNGIIWGSTPFSADASQATVQGVLYALDALTLQQLWTDRTNLGRDQIGNFAKFVPPTVANGKLLVANFGPVGAADGSGGLSVYGLLPSGGTTAPLVPDGTYVITSRNGGLVIDDPAFSTAAGTVLQVFTPNGGANQSWLLQNLTANVVSLINKSSGLALGVAGDSTANSAQIIQSTFTGDTSQEWVIAPVDGGFFELTNVRSGQSLDVAGGSTAAGTVLNQFPYHAAPWEQWSFQ